ncbi:signal peptidase I [Paenactinomyces guangxiensis]|uniref:Signal peptidase I n=1 Tax=Paenactinomyces guangxiensis TaxID=1490290 RepID=A0A7W1WSX1_9BACL|nr:signal peptidase I [Paenactinomyces guangxiensis]MBA4495459.1 signal peptidase I [Paenactinomyces guangxiensis]MBH8592418.1 signal peptidase I [Paenactinomyces guangxiensis]
MQVRFKRWGLMLIFATLFAIAFNQYGFALSEVNGTSMQPTLHNGDRLLINKFKFFMKQPSVGEVITFKDPTEKDRYLVKRVVGIPGDRIEIKNGALYRNGLKVDERYINSPIEDGDYGPVSVQPGTVFVMGDNRHRSASRDSRYQSVGLVPFNLIDGKVELILWRPSLAASL